MCRGTLTGLFVIRDIFSLIEGPCPVVDWGNDGVCYMVVSLVMKLFHINVWFLFSHVLFMVVP